MINDTEKASLAVLLPLLCDFFTTSPSNISPNANGQKIPHRIRYLKDQARTEDDINEWHQDEIVENDDYTNPHQSWSP